MDSEKKSKLKDPDIPLLGLFKEWTEFELFSKDFFIKHWKMFLIIGVVLILYISNRYICLGMMAEIENLKKELIDVRYEAVTRSSALIGISRPSQVKNLIRENGIEIEESDKPAYNLK